MKQKNKLKSLGLVILILCLSGLSLIFGINFYVKLGTKDLIIEDYTSLKDYDCILVLGAGVKDNKPSLMLTDRLNKAILLYQENAAPKIIMSGDHGREEYDEVNIMKDFAIDKGIPSSDIFMDHAGFSTYDSIYRAKNIFDAHKIIIVTQEYHLYRALYIAKKLGVEAVGFAAEKIKYPGDLKRNIREILARDKDFVKCIFKPQSQYLGEVIPVFGDGNLTNDK